MNILVLIHKLRRGEGDWQNPEQPLLNAAADKLEHMLPVVNAAITLARAHGRQNSQFAMDALTEATRKYKP